MNYLYPKGIEASTNLKRGSRIPPIEPSASMGFLLQFYEILTPKEVFLICNHSTNIKNYGIQSDSIYKSKQR